MRSAELSLKKVLEPRGQAICSGSLAIAFVAGQCVKYKKLMRLFEPLYWLPILITGHLISKFGITEADWHRIKQNIDSKCRTAFRRKQRGMPLTVKAFRGKSTSYITPNTPGELITSDDDSLTQDDSGLTIHHVRYPSGLDKHIF